MNKRPDPKTSHSFLPLQPYEFQVLVVLGDGDLHGYGIRRETLERTNGRLRLDPGVLYRTLRRLQQAGLIEESARRPAADLDDQRRRYYSLTQLGRKVSLAEAERLDQLISTASVGKLLKQKGTA